ncbi:MAG: hypothetical protein L0H64_13195 [Pseudonocardia sp.]|nr:hypothetical protein [Pseudonocardia sp.]
MDERADQMRVEKAARGVVETHDPRSVPAAWALQDGSPDVELAVSVAQATCSEAYRRVALDAVQMLGGIGFTWEHPAHLYLKRAVTDAELLGSAAAHREHIAALVLDAAVPTRPLTVACG